MARAKQRVKARPRSVSIARTAWALGALALIVYVASMLWR
jgi:hypothetical protein